MKTASNFSRSMSTVCWAIAGSTSSTFRSRLLASAAARTFSSVSSTVGRAWLGSVTSRVNRSVASLMVTGSDRDCSLSWNASNRFNFAIAFKSGSLALCDGEQPAMPSVRSSRRPTLQFPDDRMSFHDVTYSYLQAPSDRPCSPAGGKITGLRCHEDVVAAAAAIPTVSCGLILYATLQEPADGSPAPSMTRPATTGASPVAGPCRKGVGAGAPNAVECRSLCPPRYGAGHHPVNAEAGKTRPHRRKSPTPGASGAVAVTRTPPATRSRCDTLTIGTSGSTL